MVHYRVLPHTADVMIMVDGRSYEELFKRAGESLSSIVVDRRGVRERREEKVVLDGSGIEELLFNFLRWIHYLIHAENFLIRTAGGTINRGLTKFTARAGGETYDERRHVFKTEVKAVTLHNFKVEKRGTGYRATYVLDV